jgi:hypothetical protein
MKSLIEEASSISKAVEKAWERAGKPHSFSVKIFELPEKNFIGMTTKYAKVGVFFEDKKSPEINIKQIEKTNQAPLKKQFEKKSPVHASSNQKIKDSETTELTKKPKTKINSIDDASKVTQTDTKHPVNSSEQPVPEINATWNNQMKVHLESWLKEVLMLVGLAHVEFTCHEQKNVLKVNFDSPLIGNELKESLLYKNLSYLGMVSLRTHFKNEMKHLKILLSRE